ncbi:hypothetical protein HBH92_111970 [Parastagonospora nodorum]|nr:hypothetical protein HBH92_111970 [Parastagonospora nodorum]KAH4439090.1 hypothetical protein HBH93_090830 [Parastagonospora nodorum]KAH4444935.1 hypothetical protein HBH91_148490 [Parastagonospora nodorum]KAH4492850.1 hypothetical protein HBH89_166610 [Parastagonospora nodorum]KAH4545809.1 hypothetical protein HBH85_080170 [Parastagonospora nodorum]
MAIIRRRIRCHYCNMQSRDSVSNIPRQYLCPHCDAVNHFDERGNITDPPADFLLAGPSASSRYAHSRSPSPVMSAPAESPFCGTCQRNQTLVQNLIAEYLPDEDDPEYARYEAHFDGYRAELEGRYPQVCKDCEERVNDQIRRAGYVAKADHLRRVMERSEKKRRTPQTSRQAWTLRLIALAKWTYILSFFVQLLWHISGSIMAVDPQSLDGDRIIYPDSVSLDVCVCQAISVRQVDDACVFAQSVTQVVVYAIVADVLTLWWNPRLKDKTNSITGRMRGLRSLWAIRAAVVVMRSGSLYYWQQATIDRENIATFHHMHWYMLAVMSLSFILTFKTVRISYQSPTSFRNSVNEQASSTTNSPGPAPRSTYKPAHPQASAFDTMAQGFTTSFNDFNDALDAPAYPPSPTLTNSSFTTHATEATTPFKSVRGDDDMDWTPTQRRFAPVQPAIIPSPWSKQQPSPPPQPASHSPHSLFSKPDTNPFRHKVPAAPKAPAQAKADPWKRSVWDPPLKETTPNFFAEDQKARGEVGETKGLDGFGVPRNVKRDAELFASPKFKYDYYGTMKDTGLEDRFEETFNDFFSK